MFTSLPGLGKDAIPLTLSTKIEFPKKLAVVIGREVDGVSQCMRSVATREIYLPMFGFTESFNLSVAAALTLQRLFDLCPEARGDLPKEEKDRIRKLWYDSMVKTPKAKEETGPWLEKSEQIPLLEDLRRESREAWMSPKIKRRKVNLPAEQERLLPFEEAKDMWANLKEDSASAEEEESSDKKIESVDTN